MTYRMAGGQAGMSPIARMLYAAWCGETARVRELLDQGVPVEATDGKGRTALMLAAARGAVETVALLLEAGVAPDVVLNSRGERPLHCVYSAAMARVLLAAGADVNAVDAEGYTPLMQARAQDAELIRLLVEAGADVNARNAQGSVLAHLPRRSEEVDRLLFEAGARYCADNMNDVECAVADPNIRWLRMLLEDGADVNRVNEAGQTPLILAAWGARAAAVRVLLGAGAADCIDLCDAEEGVTALHAAVIACRSRVRVCPENIEALLAAGADVNLPDRDGWTPLHSCAFYNLPQLVPLLLAAGADPTLVDKRGIKPAEMAREKGHAAVARLLEL